MVSWLPAEDHQISQTEAMNAPLTAFPGTSVSPRVTVDIWSDIACPTRADHVWGSPIVVLFRVTMSRSDRTHVPGVMC